MTTQIVEYPSTEEVALAVGTLKLLADATRLRIIWALVHGEHSVNELADHVGVAATSVSQHLAKLRLSHLVQTRREGNRIFYRVADEHVRRLVEQSLGHADHLVARESTKELSRVGA
jgi:ArsR family transcriptional regulator